VAQTENLSEVIVHTGQHYDANMSDIFFDELSIPKPAYHLGIGGGHHGQMTGRQLEQIEAVLLDEKPDQVLVYGDTNSTLAGALAAAKLHIPVAHVEAGLRSFNRLMPEEINRVLTDHVSDVLFAPTEVAVRNLANEGISGDKVKQVGDVMFDAALFYKPQSVAPSWFDAHPGLKDGYVLTTIHRAENTDDPERLRRILQGLGDCGLPVVLPLHPRTRKTIQDLGITLPDTIKVFDPVGYLEMIFLQTSATVIATDSGGVQKEAYFHNVPCVTLRDETEWVELVKAGWNTICPPLTADIAGAISAAKRPDVQVELYGRGTAAQDIVDVITNV
ncbi:MAG: non-hydrolyzing UDP-N-acetylglucosamine 2-epimerase, partial [Planktomarina sp.]